MKNDKYFYFDMRIKLDFKIQNKGVVSHALKIEKSKSTKLVDETHLSKFE